MPSFDNYTESQVTKLLYLGHTGAGKTGSLVSLAAAGYNVRILDLDKGVEIIKDFVLNPQSPYRRAKPGLWTQEQADSISERITFVPVSETVKVIKLQAGGSQIAPQGDSWKKVITQLDDWKDGTSSLGSLSSWGPKDILVIDGMSRLADAAFSQQLAMNGRLLGRPEQSDYGAAQSAIIRLLKMLYSDDIKCNVIIVCHIAFIETEAGPTRGFPQTIGRAIGPQIGQFFNHALMAKASGQGDNTKRVIVTNTSGMIELKSAAPLRVKGEYDLSTGLAEYFRDVRLVPNRVKEVK